MPSPTIDNADGQSLDLSRADQFALPQVILFEAIYRGGWNTYWMERHDEALRMGRDQADAMLRDEFLLGILFERFRSLMKLRWYIAVDDPDDPRHKLVAEGIEKCVRQTPNFRQLVRSLAWAVWYGRSGTQLRWAWRPIEVGGGTDPLSGMAMQPQVIRGLTVAEHRMVNGDKIAYTVDQCPAILTNAAEIDKLPGAKVTNTTIARAVELRGSWRERFLIHKVNVFDQTFFQGERADAIHGLGIRHFLAWNWWLRQEFLTAVMRALDRLGLGMVVIEYADGDDAAKQEAIKTAKNLQAQRSVLVVPRKATGPGDSVKVLETPIQGAQVMQILLEAAERKAERFIIGQTASSRSETSGLGTHDTDFQAETKNDITEEDAYEIAETLTGSLQEPGLVSTIKRWVFPWAESIPARFAWGVKTVKSDEKLAAVASAFALGVTFKADEVRELTGMAKPGPDDEVLSLQQQTEQAAALEMQQADQAHGHAMEQGQQKGDQEKEKEAEKKEGEQEGGGPFEPQQGEELPLDDDDEELLERIRKRHGKSREDYARQDQALHYVQQPAAPAASAPASAPPSASASPASSPAHPTGLMTAPAAVAHHLAAGRPFTEWHVGNSTRESFNEVRRHLGAALNAGHVTRQIHPQTGIDTFYPHPSLPVLHQLAQRPMDIHQAVRASGIDARHHSEAFVRLSERGLIEEAPNSQLGMETWQASQAGRSLLAGEVPPPGRGQAMARSQPRASSWVPPVQQRQAATTRQATATRESEFKDVSGGNFKGRVSKPTYVERHLEEAGLGHLPEHELAGLSGANEGEVSLGHAGLGGFGIKVEHPGFYMERTVSRVNGELVMHNDLFRVKQGGQGKGLELFSNQVKSLLAHGFARIETLAAGTPAGALGGYGMNGFITWPKFGYDGPIPESIRQGMPEQYRSAKTVQELRAMPGGEDAWAEHGGAFNATFDLSPGSKSLALLNEYRQRKGLPPIEHPAAAQQRAGKPATYARDSALRERIQEAARSTDTDPTDEQKRAGNYRKGHVTIQGLDITIETPKGAARSGKAKDGKEWSVIMAHHYGYIKRTESEADGDHIDVFVGPDPESEIVFVIDQDKESGKFDEHKCMLGFSTKADATQGYLACYSPGWKGLGGVTPMTMDDFKKWTAGGDTGKRMAD